MLGTIDAVMALLVQKEFFRVQDFGVETMQIVQTDQRFVFHKPLKEGDELSCWFVIETHKESFGVDIVTIGQYLAPSKQHLAIARYLEPAEFDELRQVALGLGIAALTVAAMAAQLVCARTGHCPLRRWLGGGVVAT